jgi:hypothetical protein
MLRVSILSIVSMEGPLEQLVVRESVYALDSRGCGDELDRDTPRSGSEQNTV